MLPAGSSLYLTGMASSSSLGTFENIFVDKRTACKIYLANGYVSKPKIPMYGFLELSCDDVYQLPMCVLWSKDYLLYCCINFCHVWQLICTSTVALHDFIAMLSILSIYLLYILLGSLTWSLQHYSRICWCH